MPHIQTSKTNVLKYVFNLINIDISLLMSEIAIVAFKTKVRHALILFRRRGGVMIAIGGIVITTIRDNEKQRIRTRRRHDSVWCLSTLGEGCGFACISWLDEPISALLHLAGLSDRLNVQGHTWYFPSNQHICSFPSQYLVQAYNGNRRHRETTSSQFNQENVENMPTSLTEPLAS